MRTMHIIRIVTNIMRIMYTSRASEICVPWATRPGPASGSSYCELDVDDVDDADDVDDMCMM